MDLQSRISRMLAMAGTALMATGVVAGALIGDAAAAPQRQPDGQTEHADHADHTTTTSDATTSTTRKPRSQRTTTTTEPPTTTTTSASKAKAAATTTTVAPSTTTTTAPTTTTTAAATRSQAPDPDRSAAQVGPTTSSTAYAPISRGPKSPVVPPQNPPPAGPVTSTTVANPIPPAPVADPLPRTPVTGLSGPPPNPLSLEAVQESAPPVGPPLPPWDTGTTTQESENARQSSGAATQTPVRRPSGQLGMTGSATRTLLFLAGIALLLGAIAVALGEPGPLRTARATATGPETANAKTKHKARTRRLRRTIPGWESGVPLAPTRRAAKRARLERRGLLELSPPGGEPAA